MTAKPRGAVVIENDIYSSLNYRHDRAPLRATQHSHPN